MSSTVLDSLDMRGTALALATQLQEAIDRCAAPVAGLPAHDDVENVLVMGMGGSGIAGDVLAAAASPECPVPIVVSKDYELPGFVGEGTLLIALSCSGDTEETVEAATAGVEAGATLVAICQGGRLAELARSWGATVLPVPTSIVMPRAGIGALAVPAILAMHQMGLYPDARQQLADAVRQLERRSGQLAGEASPAAALARRIGRTIPLVYGGGPIGAVAAARWKGQFNENAKAPAFANRVPELCHNEACGWGQHGDVTRQVLTLIELRHDHEHPQITRRFELVEELVGEVVGSIQEVRAEGEGPLAQLFDLVMLGDLTSIELALQEGIDPGPIPALDFIKAGLS